MSKRPRTPAQIIESRGEKETYSFSLKKSQMIKLKQMASNSKLPISTLVDEAIAFYIDTVSEKSAN